MTTEQPTYRITTFTEKGNYVVSWRPRERHSLDAAKGEARITLRADPLSFHAHITIDGTDRIVHRLSRSVIRPL